MNSSLYNDTDYLDFLIEAESTGELYKEAINWFDSGQIVFSDQNGDTQSVNLVAHPGWIPKTVGGTNLPDMIHLQSDEVKSNISEYWMDNLETLFDYHGFSDIYNGTVVQTIGITDDGIDVSYSDFFTVRSHREQYRSKVASVLYDNNIQPNARSVDDLESVYSLIGCTYTVILNPEDLEGKYILVGRRSKTMSEFSGAYTVCPCGLLEEHHFHESDSENITSVIKHHFTEELAEEALNSVHTEEELESTLSKSNTEYTVTGITLDPVKYSLEISAMVEISGGLADFLIESHNPNEEFSSLQAYPADDVFSIKDSTIFNRTLTPQSRVSLSLAMCELQDWEVSIKTRK